MLDQEHQTLELLLIDDGSTDGSVAELQSVRDPRLKIHRQSNKGVCVARNAGLDMAQGKYILFMDGDDWLDKRHLTSLLQTVSGGYDVAVSDWVESDQAVSESKSPPADLSIESYVCSSPWALHAALMRLDYLQNTNVRWSVELNRLACEDNRFWFQVLRQASVGFSGQATAFYRVNLQASRTKGTIRARWMEGFLIAARKNVKELDAGEAEAFGVAARIIESVFIAEGRAVSVEFDQKFTDLWNLCVDLSSDPTRNTELSLRIRKLLGFKLIIALLRLVKLLGHR